MHSTKSATCLAAAVTLLCSAATVAGQVIHVDADAPGANNGTTWVDAYVDLQDALAAAGPGDEIRVAQGVYTPADPTGERAATFELITGVALYGGYAGYGEPDPDERDVVANVTVLSGDRSGDDGTEFENNEENSYHVVSATGVDETAVLDGFKVTAGHANGDWWSNNHTGGGMFNLVADPTIIACTFTANWALYGGGMANLAAAPNLMGCSLSYNDAWNDGGGMFNLFSDPILTDCSVTDNGARGFGAGIYNEDTDGSFTGCTLSGNTAIFSGAGMCNQNSSPTVTSCVFTGNSADYFGGGIYTREGAVTVTDCVFIDNSATRDGGGIYTLEGGATVIDCVFIDNSAPDGSGGAIEGDEGSDTVANCVFIDNTAARRGGAIQIDNGSVANCVFTGNSALGGGAIQLYNGSVTNGMFTSNSAGSGGAIRTAGGSVAVANCLFTGNSADNYGGGILGEGIITVANCVFAGNSASWGGAMRVYEGSGTVTNGTFNGNTADEYGGAMYIDEGSLAVQNCTFSGNVAPTGRAIAFDGGASDVLFSNCIVQDGGDEVFNNDGSTILMEYTNVAGGWLGMGNIDADPLFADPDGPDGVPGTEDDNLRLAPGSPCINTGDPEFSPEPGETDLDGHARVLCDRVDMGAYEFGIGDYDCDRTVDLFDFAQWIDCITGPQAEPYGDDCEPFDFDYDGDVDLQDFGGFQRVFE